MRRAVLSVATLAILVGVAAPAEAIPPVLRPGTRPMWAAFSFGPAINVTKSVTQFKLIETFGYHFSGTASGPAIAVDIQESFGEGITALELAPKFVWDIQIVDGLGFYLSPAAALGYVHAGGGGYSYNGFTMQFIFEGKLVLGDRGMVFFRPFSFDLLGVGNGSFTMTARYDMMWGGGVIF